MGQCLITRKGGSSKANLKYVGSVSFNYGYDKTTTATCDISNTYSNYSKLSVDDIIFPITYSRGWLQDSSSVADAKLSNFKKSYDPSTGIITISATGGYNYCNTQFNCDIYVLDRYGESQQNSKDYLFKDGVFKEGLTYDGNSYSIVSNELRISKYFILNYAEPHKMIYVKWYIPDGTPNNYNAYPMIMNKNFNYNDKGGWFDSRTIKNIEMITAISSYECLRLEEFYTTCYFHVKEIWVEDID